MIQGYGFDNIGDVLSLPPILLEKYLSAAERIAEAAIVTQPAATATLVKYLASRVEGDENFFPDGAYRVSHSFPFAGEYELQMRVIDRRYRPKEGETPTAHAGFWHPGRLPGWTPAEDLRGGARQVRKGHV